MSERNKLCPTCQGATELPEDLHEQMPEGFGWCGPIARCPECGGYQFYLGPHPKWYEPIAAELMKQFEKVEQERIKKRISDPSRLP